ncbi:MAG: toll/interleukin-1 receptor domain-containing protein [Clostridium sp.]|nr:toll/interleukin-1 receptor domain-containing protein [Clostridium sp.]
MNEYAFDAFISYSHRDLKWGKWLQRKLETFRIPKDMAKDGRDTCRFRVFRDQTDLAGTELEEALRKELSASRWLIVICSPASAASSWVNDEVLAFQAMDKANYIIPFIVDGEPESENPDLECYPPGLRNLDGRHMLGANVKEIGKDKAFLKLVSILLDVRFNRLVDREKQRRRRTAIITGSILASVSAVIIGLTLRNAVISKRNHELSYDIYVAALERGFQYGAELEDNLQAVDVNLLTASAKEGNTDAILLLGSCWLNGWGCEKNEEEALHWYRKGAEAGDAKCMISLGNCLQFGHGTEENPEEAFSWYLRAAEAGDPYGMVTAGYAYEGGIGTETDPEKAFAWYNRAAEAGYDEGMMQTARCCRDGIGCEPDREKAFSWNLKLAELGNTDAMYNTALMYQHGYGTEENPEQAYAWYRKGAEAGDAKCAYFTGWCTENSYGTKDAALEWYRKAAELAESAGDDEVAKAAAGEAERLEKDGK